MWLKFYVGLLAVSCVHFTKAVDITPYQPVISVAEGSYLEVNCTSRGSIQWFANVSLHSRPFVTANGGEGDTLVFSNVTRANAATYTCQRRQGMNLVPDQASFTLRVFTVTTRNAVFMENHNATLSCHVEDPGTYTYIWKKGETFVSDIPMKGKQAFVSDSNGTLEIRHPAHSAAGQFTCIAVERRHDEDGRRRVTRSGYSFGLNRDVVLECPQVVPGQLHIYSWTKDYTPIFDIPLKENQPFIIHGNGSLEIRNIVSDFILAGQYVCTATYVQPYAIETKVNYYAKPKVDSLDKSKMENGNQVLVCNVLGYPESIITWWKGNNRIKGGDNSGYKLSAAVYNGMTVNDAKLEIQGDVSEDGEDYKCMAQNRMWPGFSSTSTIHVSDAFSHVHTGPLTTFIGLCVVLSTMFM